MIRKTYNVTTTPNAFNLGEQMQGWIIKCFEITSVSNLLLKLAFSKYNKYLIFDISSSVGILQSIQCFHEVSIRWTNTGNHNCATEKGRKVSRVNVDSQKVQWEKGMKDVKKTPGEG